MNKFNVGDVAMYGDNNEFKLVHIVVIQESNTKSMNLFGEEHRETKYRYLIEESRDNVQKLVWEHELIDIKNQSSYLIIPRKDDTSFIEGAPARMLAAMIIDHLPELNGLEEDAYYKCEDKLTEFINEYMAGLI